MEVTRFEAAPVYTAPGHEEIVARRLQGGEVTSVGFAVVGHSTVPDGATIPMDAGVVDKLYIIVAGTLDIIAADGTTYALSSGDSIFVAAGEARAVVNHGGTTAALIVVTPPTGA